MADLAAQLGAVDKASLFDAVDRAAARVGLALFVVHVSASPPTLIYVSELLATLLGRRVDDLVGKPAWELVTPAQRDLVRDTIASRGPGAQPLTMEVEIDRADGTPRAIEVGVARITTSGAEIAVGYFRDISERRDVLAALRRSDALSRSLIENAPDGVVLLQAGRIVLANPVSLRMFGLPDFESARGRLLADFLPPAEAARAAERIGRILDGETIPSAEYTLINGFSAEVHSVKCVYEDKPTILSFVRDIKERRRMHEQLSRAGRLAALGTMAAAVAHEINNPLTYLQLSLQRIAREVTTEKDPARAAILRECLDNALDGVERVARIVRDLRAYSRDQGDEPEGPVDVVAAADRALRMVDHELRYRAQLVRKNPDVPAIVDASPGRLEQILVNLLVNAMQALEPRAGRTDQITVDIVAGDEIEVRITDTGRGISEPDRVFEPFVTTKPIGEGTGLGLSVSKQLVERMRGRIEIASTGPSGTTIAVILPRRLSPVPARTVAPAPAPGPRLRILVVDDEPQVRAAIHSLLSLDHDVDVAADGESALALLATSGFDVILCDLMMPRMTGRDVYEQIRTRWPGREHSIVFITGGAFVPTLASFLESVGNVVLRKPFTVEHVLSAVREVKRSPATP